MEELFVAANCDSEAITAEWHTRSELVTIGTYLVKDKNTLSSIIDFSHSHNLLIDTADLYQNQSDILNIGKGYSNFRIGTKLHKTLFPGLTLEAVKRLFHANGDKPIERVLLHAPLPIHMWRDLETAIDAGFVSTIGVSNFDLRTLQILVDVARIKPSIVQGEFHPFLPDLDATLALISYCKMEGICFEAHSLLCGSKPRYIQNTDSHEGLETILQALSHTLDVSPSDTARELITWARHRASSIRLCLKSTSVERLEELLCYAQMPVQSTAMTATLSNQLSHFRLYPLAMTNNEFTKSLSGNWTTITKMLASIPDGVPSPELVQRVVRAIEHDTIVLTKNSSHPSSEDSSTTGIAQQLFGRKGKGDMIVFAFVAAELFGDTAARAAVRALEGSRDSPEAQMAQIFQQWRECKSLQSAISLLNNRLKKLRQLADCRKPAKAPKSCPLIRVSQFSDPVMHPVPMPVDVSDISNLRPFFDWITGLTETPTSDVQFKQGALLSGGHLDMCKQVVGPAHMAALCDAVQQAAARGIVRHFLLGNNVAFDAISRLSGPGAAQASTATREQGIEALLETMTDQYAIRTWYLAGNCIDGEIMKRIADVLVSNTVCESLWLKRNPIGGSIGATAVGRLLALNSSIEVLDLHNCGLGDEGLTNLNAAESEHLASHSLRSVLKHIHLAANGITTQAAPALAAVLARHAHQLESVYLEINQLGDAGVATVCAGLAGSTALQRFLVGANGLTQVGLDTVVAFALTLPNLAVLDVGYYKSTEDLGQGDWFNNFTDAAPLVHLLEQHPAIRVLKAERCSMPLQELSGLLHAVQHRGDVHFYGQQGTPETNGIAHAVYSKAELEAILNPPIVNHIYSIYRNKM